MQQPNKQHAVFLVNTCKVSLKDTKTCFNFIQLTLLLLLSTLQSFKRDARIIDGIFASFFYNILAQRACRLLLDLAQLVYEMLLDLAAIQTCHKGVNDYRILQNSFSVKQFTSTRVECIEIFLTFLVCSWNNHQPHLFIIISLKKERKLTFFHVQHCLKCFSENVAYDYIQWNVVKYFKKLFNKSIATVTALQLVVFLVR